MEKTISIRDWSTIKRVAQNVQPLVAKKNSIKEKIEELNNELTSLDMQIQGHEYGIKALCGGLGTEDLCHRVVTVIEGKFDKDGRPQKKTTYEPNDNIAFNEEKRVYVITIPDPEPQGSDYDIDNSAINPTTKEATQE